MFCLKLRNTAIYLIQSSRTHCRFLKCHSTSSFKFRYWLLSMQNFTISVYQLGYLINLSQNLYCICWTVLITKLKLKKISQWVKNFEITLFSSEKRHNRLVFLSQRSFYQPMQVRPMLKTVCLTDVSKDGENDACAAGGGLTTYKIFESHVKNLTRMHLSGVKCR